MTDQPFPDRVTQLRRRWDADRTSRLFLQLAEEYRQLGRLRESVEVLDAGLVEHPGYLSALVAKGRCHLELGEPQAAREALERVVRQDATQAVASKLLVRSYLDLGDLVRARERLSLYALLHETDPDIVELRRRLDAPEVQPPARAAQTSGSDDPTAAEALGEKSLTPARSDAMNEDIFDLGIPPMRPLPGPGSDDLFGLYERPRADRARFADLDEPQPLQAVDDGQIFPGLGGGDSRRRWAEGLALGGIFDPTALDLEPVVAVHVSAPAELSAFRPPAPASTPVFLEEASLPLLGFEPPLVEPQAAMPIEPPAEAEPEALKEHVERQAAPAAKAVAGIPAHRPGDNETVTLAELYLGQGHRAEALRILDQVLLREPENRAARALFSQIRGEGPAAAEPEPESQDQVFTTRLAPLPAEAAFVTSEPPSAPPTPSLSKPQRKIQLLTAYLERLRRGSAPGVS